MKRLLIAGAALVALAACSSPSQAPSSGGTPEARTLTVFAAASLTESFTSLEKTFEQQNPGVDVVLSYGGSSDLAQQIVNGAPADVFAAASDSTMKTVTDAQLTAAAPTVFATNGSSAIIPLTRRPIIVRFGVRMTISLVMRPSGLRSISLVVSSYPSGNDPATPTPSGPRWWTEPIVRCTS